MKKFFLVLILGVFVFGNTQRAKITNSFVSEVLPTDFTQEEYKGKIAILIKSEKLRDFMENQNPKSDTRLQEVILNSTYTEFEKINNSLSLYSNNQNSKSRIKPKSKRYELEKVGDNLYVLVNATEPIDKQRCKILLQKELVRIFDNKTDMVVNLDNQHYFNKANKIRKFIECW